MTASSKTSSLLRFLFVVTSCLALPLCAHGQLFSEDYEGETVGAQPTANSVRPNTNTTTASVDVLAAANNPAGTGNGVRVLDNDAAVTTGLEYNFVPNVASQISAFRLDFSFSNLTVVPTGSSSDEYQTVSGGEFFDAMSNSANLNSNGRRFFEIRLYADNTVDFISNGAVGTDSTNNPLLTGMNTLSAFVNDFDMQSVSYTNPNTNMSATLAANSVAYYLNGTFFFETDLDTGDATANNPSPMSNVGNSEGNFGRIGINTNTATFNTSYAFDNIVVTQIPEPSTLAGLAAGSLFLLARRRRRKMA